MYYKSFHMALVFFFLSVQVSHNLEQIKNHNRNSPNMYLPVALNLKIQSTALSYRRDYMP